MCEIAVVASSARGDCRGNPYASTTLIAGTGDRTAGRRAHPGSDIDAIGKNHSDLLDQVTLFARMVLSRLDFAGEERARPLLMRIARGCCRRTTVRPPELIFAPAYEVRLIRQPRSLKGESAEFGRSLSILEQIDLVAKAPALRQRDLGLAAGAGGFVRPEDQPLPSSAGLKPLSPNAIPPIPTAVQVVPAPDSTGRQSSGWFRSSASASTPPSSQCPRCG